VSAAFYARSADFYSFSIGQFRPLEIWIFSCFFCGVVFTAQEISFAGSIGSFFAYRTFFCHRLYAILKKAFMQGIELFFSIAILIMSVVIHEVSHGYAAYLLGDPTAKYAGRLTLNPVKHLDFFGSFLIPFISYIFGGFIFGWAKPVPFNPYNLKNPKWNPGVVAASGPLANFSIALVLGLLIRYGAPLSFFPASFFQIISLAVFINLVLGFFNLVPIPPLDGSKVLFSFLPYNWRHIQDFLERYGFFILLIFIFFFFQSLLPVILWLFKVITGTGF
jgi:Zn-dependent protease